MKKIVCKYAEDLRLGSLSLPAAAWQDAGIENSSWCVSVKEELRTAAQCLSQRIFSLLAIPCLHLSLLMSGLFPVESLSAFPCFYCSHCPCIKMGQVAVLEGKNGDCSK